jgi:Zn ribbon nucleic-acid-binding protein
MKSLALHLVCSPPLAVSDLSGAILVGLFLGFCLIIDALIITGIIKLICVACGFLAKLRDRKLLRRLKNNQCPECGYDMRATPTLCPECGHQRGQMLWRPSSQRNSVCLAASPERCAPGSQNSRTSGPAAKQLT